MDNGGFGDIWGSLLLLIAMIILILFSIFFRRRRGGKTRVEVVVGLLSEINHNLKITDAFSSNWQIRKKFKIGNWNRNKSGLDFLDQPLQIALSDAFSLAEDFNLEIDAAKKHKSSSYLASIQVDRLREPLARSKQGLQEWLQANLQTELSQPPRRRGLFG